MGSFQERRKFPRAEIRWPVMIKTDQRVVECEARDIGPSGVCVFCPEPLALTNGVSMAIRIPHLNQTATVAAQGVWSNVHGVGDQITLRGIGFRFTDISDEDRKSFSELAIRHHMFHQEVPETLESLEALTIGPTKKSFDRIRGKYIIAAIIIGVFIAAAAWYAKYDISDQPSNLEILVYKDRIAEQKEIIQSRVEYIGVLERTIKRQREYINTLEGKVESQKKHIDRLMTTAKESKESTYPAQTQEIHGDSLIYLLEPTWISRRKPIVILSGEALLVMDEVFPDKQSAVFTILKRSGKKRISWESVRVGDMKIFEYKKNKYLLHVLNISTAVQDRPGEAKVAITKL